MYRPDELIHSTYRIEKALSMRGPVVTYGATAADGTKVVLRCLHVSEITDWTSVGRFEKAARTLQRMTHPGIPRFIEFFEEAEGHEPSYCLVRRWIDGNPLTEQPTGTDTVKSVLEQGLDIISYFHSFSPPVIHGSIRPEHLIVSPDGKLSVIWNGQEESETTERVKAGKQLDIRDLGLSMLAWLHGLRYEDLSYGNPYSSGMVPEPGNRLERVIRLMVSPSDGTPISGAELKRLLSGETGRIGETPVPPRRSRQDSDEEAPLRFDSNGAVVRRMGNLSLNSTDERDILTVEHPGDEKPENQLAKFALGTWLKWPWLVILVLSGISGGSFFFPLFIFWVIPPARKFVKKLYSRFNDSRVVIDRANIASSDQLPPFPLRDIDDIQIKRNSDEHGRITLEFFIYDRKGEKRSFCVNHLTREQADTVSEFIMKRIEERRGE